MKQVLEVIFVVFPLLLYWIVSGKMDEEHRRLFPKERIEKNTK